MKKYYIFLVVVAAISLVAIAASNLLRRDPVHDRTAVSDLHTLSNEVDTHYLREKKLPESLSEITVQDRNALSRAGQYEYRKVSSVSYELCATFRTDQRSEYTRPEPVPDSKESYRPDPSNHAKGRQCFVYTMIPVGQVVPPDK
jgi:hypothetical protein